MTRRFRDRMDAGRQLGSRLAHLRHADAIVLGLPRGGVPIAYQVARALHAPMEVLNVRKLTVPWHDELAIGAIGTGGVRVLNNETIMMLGVTREDLDAAIALQAVELARRERLYRRGRPAPTLSGRTVVIVDDGIAMGATIRSAILVVKSQRPATLVVATPVVQAEMALELARDVDEVVAIQRPQDLGAISVWYEDFSQLTDEEVRQLLRLASAEWAALTDVVNS